MKLFGRQDLLLIGALTAALVVVFSSTITRVLEYVREIERQSGLTLMPALAVLIAALVFHLLRRHYLNQARTAAAEVATRSAQQRAEELERLVAFGQALGRALDFDAIRVAIGQHLALLAGTDEVWVLVREGNEWQALSGDTRGVEGVLQWGDIAEQLLSSGADKAAGQLTQSRAVGFPLIVGGSAMGVLGVRPQQAVLAADRRRIIEAAATLLAVSIKNAQLAREVRESSVRDSLTQAPRCQTPIGKIEWADEVV